MSEWEETTLGEISIGKGSYGIAASAVPFDENKFTYLRITDIRDDGSLDKSGLMSVADPDASRYVLRPGDLVIARTGASTGRNYLYDGRDGQLVYAGFLIKFSLNPKKVYPPFVKYCCLSQEYREWIDSFSNGSTRGNINAVSLAKLPLSLPPLPTQRRIAAVLSALDDKIELNNRINANLEAQAQALFRSWFVDFEPWGGEMPSGWREGTLKDVLALRKDSVSAGQKPHLPYLPIDSIPMHSLGLTDLRPNSEAQSSLLEFQVGDVLVGAMRVYFHRVVLAPVAGITRSTCFVLRPRDKAYRAFALLQTNQTDAIEFAQQTSKGSTMPYAVWEGGLGDFPIIVPSKDDAGKFDQILEPILKRIQQSFFENRTLAALRDALLPKLMRGEIDVEKVEVAG
jgi:type I restriction enzyme S subunit